ncbi:patatin-like phospholipase family protein [Bradyrhizobium icense]|uniref:PNPLA domain-containing protein n=1 Tax=Bradyrhizobium icense TaxID=1274631 RepID=A0A1B1UCF0_9BRAD|nr:patatin-like phospholipase family protein [Bradyrhizobium icense]ANW00450.1 hypothetical protein LMTR13_10005 [Bradyrhizobium icense]
MSTREPLPAFEDRAPSDRYCDLILTGGVTSSIAYPAAVFALATAYRFNSIGGSSSGAGVAALAAAAEYRRRHGSSHGFQIMLERTAAVADNVHGKTRLAWLFQPEEENRRLFNALLPGFAKPSGKLCALALGIVRSHAIVFIIAIIILVIALGAAALRWIDYSSAFLTGTLSFVGAVIAMLIFVACEVRRLVRHDYGLCTGSRVGKSPLPPLTDWLHGLIQEIAGRKVDDEPLTFADLAKAPGSPRETLNDPCSAGASSINLQMFTTNVTHGRPYIFPQQEDGEVDDPPLYFRSSEMRRLFPQRVVECMMRKSSSYDGNAKPAPVEPAPVGLLRRVARWFVSLVGSSVAGGEDEPEEEPLYPLPREHLPILVAARMSVSFPVLFSAVPLWILDERDKQKPVFRRCLFCDGGICSNFPIHLFDSPIPSWPTFGISLHEIPQSEQGAARARRPWWSLFRWWRLWRRTLAWIWLSSQQCLGTRWTGLPRKYGVVRLPRDHLEGREDQWSEFEAEPGSFDRLSGFFSALASTTINWNDATLARLPGVRERVARVRLRSGIGGLNIRMTGDQIRGLADLGRVAALKLLKRYAFPVARPSDELSDDKLSDGWNEHRWVRLNVLRDSLATSLAGLTWAASHVGYGKPLRDLIRLAIDEPVLKKDKDSQLLAAQAAALEGALDALIEAERALNMSTAGQPYRPSPRPVMRVRPPL